MGGSSFSRTPSPQRASWFLDLEASGQLDLDPPYQRRSVWGPSFKEFFIDSLVRNYPTQAIFIEIAVDPDRPSMYRVLDGKQRLTSLIEFVRGEFETPQSLEDLQLDGFLYADLPREVKVEILKYLFTVETVSDASQQELNQVFDRLNRNVARLNRQELRHAQFDGAFIRKMEELANRPFWTDMGISTVARSRRMLDIEFVSEIYILQSNGVQDGKNYIDEYYARWDLEVDRSEAVDRDLEGVIEYIEAIDKALGLKGTRYSNLADFYSLWAAVSELRSSGDSVAPDEAANRLAKFLDEVEEGAARSVPYIRAAVQGSNKGSNRTLRKDAILAVIRDVGVDE